MTMTPEEYEARRIRTPRVPIGLADLFVNIDNATELMLFYNGVKRAGLELDLADHARMVRARAEMQEHPGLPTLEAVRALPIRARPAEDIVAEVVATSPASRPSGAVTASTPAVPLKARSPQLAAAVADFQLMIQNHLQAVNTARSMSRRGRPPLTAADLPQATLDRFKSEAADRHFVNAPSTGINAEAVAAAKAFAVAKFGR